MSRDVRLMAVPLAAAVVFVAACGDDKSGTPQTSAATSGSESSVPDLPR
jgi:hypothetical protein